jgi:hypothetical protein
VGALVHDAERGADHLGLEALALLHAGLRAGHVALAQEALQVFTQRARVVAA